MRRTLAVAGTGIAAIATVAGCSSGSPKKGHAVAPDIKAVQAAYTTTTAAKTAKIAVNVRVSQGNSATSQAMSTSAKGVVDTASKSGELTVSLPQGGTEPVVFTGTGLIYEKLPAQALTAAKIHTPWVAIDIKKLAEKKLGGQLPQNTPESPLDDLGYIKGVSDKISKDGTATVGGVKTTHYSATVDLDKAATAKSSPAVQKLESILGSHTMPAQIWLDQQGRVRKVQFVEKLKNLPTTNGAPTNPITVNATVMISDLGTPVHITVPAKSQTTDITNKLLQQH